MRFEATEFLKRVLLEGLPAFSPRRGGWWLPAIWSEKDSELREKLLAELGPTSPSGYMSEECGWELKES